MSIEAAEAAVASSGQRVRDLKAEGADKEAVEAAVAELQAAKATLTASVEAALASCAEGTPEYDVLKAKLPAAAKPKGKEKKKDDAPQNDRAAAKAARAAQRGAKAEAKAATKDEAVLGPNLSQAEMDSAEFGNLFIQSTHAATRAWTGVKELVPSLAGQQVWVRARVATSRKQGKSLCFLQLRQSMHTAQAVVFAKEGELVGFAATLPRESVVDVFGEVTLPAEAVASCSQSAVELQVRRLYCVSRAMPELPLQLEDAARSDEQLAADPSLTRVNQDVRLNHRVIDLRTAANQGIFRLQSAVCEHFRGFLLSQGFTEIHSPKMIGTASEGGADVFRVEYFGRDAYLAQSPQLYKQMALMADLDRVFEVAPVFRSENSLTHRHMTEFVGLDMEMTFFEHYHEVLDMLDRTFCAVFDGLNQSHQEELAAVRAQHPFRDLRYRYPCLRLRYDEAMALLRDKGPAKLAEKLDSETDERARARIRERLDARGPESLAEHADTEDMGTEDEKLLGEIVAELHGQDYYIIDKFPAAVRPFYTMPDPTDPRWSNSYDIFIRGEEVTSGAQRVHDPQMLLDCAKEKGVDLSPIYSYVDSFKYGAMPHAGGGIGLERVVMLFLGLPNIRKSSMFPRDPKRLNP
mmetsp:Transcript_29492/g.87232  ORF Transcript_29492/g.87232 Transcript_29492/m.87232 type:complete len:634 (-) Transcript_29492:257-2158(-)